MRQGEVAMADIWWQWRCLPNKMSVGLDVERRYRAVDSGRFEQRDNAAQRQGQLNCCLVGNAIATNCRPWPLRPGASRVRGSGARGRSNGHQCDINHRPTTPTDTMMRC